MVGTYNATGKDGTPTYGGYSQAIVVDENYVLRIPDSIPLGQGRSAAVRGHHAVLAPAALEAPAPARRSPSSASAAWATWASRSPTRWAPR